MSLALRIAGENITAATNNTAHSACKQYLKAARESLESIDKSKLKGQDVGLFSMLQQKLQAIDPVSYPQFSSLAGLDLTVKDKWPYLIAFFGGTALIALLGRPTLFQIFSQKLETQLWDTSDIVKQNLMAMGLSLGAVLLYAKISP